MKPGDLVKISEDWLTKILDWNSAFPKLCEYFSNGYKILRVERNQAFFKYPRDIDHGCAGNEWSYPLESLVLIRAGRKRKPKKCGWKHCNQIHDDQGSHTAVNT